MHEETRQFYNSQQAQATSLRNPAIRYLHRLLTCTIFARDHMSKVQSTDMTILSAALELKSMSVGCFLADHFEAQQELSGKAKIFCGGMITPIAIHFGVNTDEPPVSLDIYLDRRTITGMGMLKTSDRLLWVLKQRTGTRLFPMPNPPLTVLLGNDGSFNEDNLTMITPVHIAATIADFLTPRAARARGQPVESDSDEEMAEEEAEYESGGDEAPRGFHMRAPEYVELLDFIDDGRREDRVFQEEQFDAVHTFMEEQRATNSRYDQNFTDINSFIKDQRAATERMEAHILAQQQQQAQYMEMMRQFGQNWGFGGQGPHFPPPPPPPSC